MDKFNINIPNILDKKIFVHKYINLDININLNKSVHKAINEKIKIVMYIIMILITVKDKKMIPYQNMIKKRMVSNFDIKVYLLLSENEIMKFFI